MLKVAAIGDRESVSGFKAVGLDVFVPGTKSDSAEILQRLCNDDYGIIYLTEEFGEYCEGVIRKYDECICPAIILIPGVKNNTGEGMKRVNRSVEKAVGSQLPD